MIKVNFNAEVDKAQAQRILAEIKKDAMGGWMELPKKYGMYRDWWIVFGPQSGDRGA